MAVLRMGRRKKPSEANAPAAGRTGDPYLDAQSVWMERYGSYVKQAYNWRLLAMLEAVALIVAVIGLLYLNTQSKLIPYVVAVDKIGQAFAVQPADRASPVDPRVVRAELANWIVKARSVVTDRIVERRALSDVYAIVPDGTAARGYLDAYYQQKGNDPFDRATRETVEVSITAILPISPTTYTVQWQEQRRDLRGKDQGTHEWEASVGIAFQPPKDESVILRDPLGLYITTLDWTQKL
ncbi:MAG: conjugal transfer protein [Candidatus Eremiobacteraeota bacterium]|nr:conjugal transfer protein [Candidatus Eremiobacteraeota bacterium]